MSVLNKLFGSNDTPSENKPTFWKKIESLDNFNAAIEESKTRKVGIFKHSTRCFISKTVLKNFEKEVNESNSEVSFYFLDLIAFRSISNLIADQLEVTHQSPQLIVIENGKAIKDASHQSIELSITQ